MSDTHESEKSPRRMDDPSTQREPPSPHMERLRGAWLGLVVGDALGAPVEFQSADDIRHRHGEVREMMSGGPWRAGEWTDDTALALATARAYLGREPFDLDAAAQAMLEWLASDPKDVGNLTRAALEAIRNGRAPAAGAGAYALAANPGSAGNGSLMRALATGLVRRIDDRRLVSESIVLSAITHADPRCTSSCAAFNAVVSALVHESADVAAALASARRLVARLDPKVVAILDGVTAGRAPMHDGTGIGYVLLTLERALVALRDSTSFEEGLVAVVGMGGDTDTNAAVAGALLGARFGLAAIPERWVGALVETEEVMGTLRGIEARLARGEPAGG